MIAGLVFGLLKAMAQAPVADFSANPTAGCGPLTVQFTDQSSNTPLFWSWDFGNGSTSSQKNPQCTYSAPGVYTVKLIVRNSSGSDAIEKTNYIIVYPFPNAKFVASLNLACAPANIQFTDQSTPGTGSVTGWAWDFGDGTTSGQQNPLHNYSTPGYYTIRLTVTNSNGCSNTVTLPRDIRVVSGIQPNFIFNQSSSSCTAPFTGELLNQSAGPGNLSFSWTMNNGASPSSSADTSPVVTFPASGQYNVSLQVNSSLGCSATAQQTIPFANGAAILNGPTTACVNAPTTFTDGSSPPPTTLLWTFGDGQTSNNTSVTKTFTSTGPSSVKLVNHYATCADSTIETVNVVNPPTPDFTTSSPTSACKAPLTVQFTDQTTPAATSWQWDFGDGQTSTQQNPSHTYTSAGSFTVTLTATGAGNCPTTITKPGLIVIQAPAVSIGGTLGACTSPTATFNAISPTANVTAVDGVASYAWTAPGSNEGSSAAANPTFTYPTANTYTISVTVTTTGGCQASASTQIQIGTPLTPSFTAPASVCNDNPATFTSTTTGATNWLWNFGDHSSPSTVGPTVMHSYRFYGSHNVTLTVVNNGCPQEAVKAILVKPPFAGFDYALPTPINCAKESLIQFADTSAEGDIPTYGPVSWSWNFGDPASGSNTSIAPDPQHQYPAPTATPTPYTVTLTVTQDGCTSTASEVVTIGTISAAITPPPLPNCRNTQLTFTSASTPASLISTYSWSVDGGTFTAPSPSTTYQTGFVSNGPHTVTLTPTDIYGCSAPSTTSTVQITGPLAQFTENPLAGGCQDLPVTFTDQTTPVPTTATLSTWSWNFGDGTSQAYNTIGPYIHAYADTGTYQVQLTVFDNVGCSNLSIQTIQITNPIANFGGDDSFYCPGAPLPFTDSSQGYNLTYSWSFGDPASGANNTSTLADPTHTFPNNAQTYNVSLTVMDKNGCLNTKTKPALIQSPIPAFNIYDTTAICTPLQTIFAAHGKYYDSLYWKFGDGASSTLDSTSHFYNNYGIDTAKLFLQGPGGCLDSTSWRVLLTNPYTATSMSFSPLSHCDSVPVNFLLGPPNYTSFQLAFGDGDYDSTGNLTPGHTYHNLGTYQPEIIETDATGCIVGIPASQSIKVLGSTPFFSIDKHAFCDSSIVNFTDYTISNDGFASETYTFGDGSAPQTKTPASGTFNTSHDYIVPGLLTVSLQVSTNSGCSETYSDTIHVYQTPHPVITLPDVTCTGLIPFQGSTTIPQVDSVFWLWDFGNGQNSQQQDPTIGMDPGIYLVSLKASVPFGCNDTTSKNITVNPHPGITGPHEITTPVGIPVTIPFTYSPNVVSFVWTPESNLSCTTCGNPVATVIFSTTYTVSVTDANSCTASDTILIKTICNDKNYWLPNTFSPNGDGVNDWFYPRGTNLYNIQSLTIFNRWGQQVFQRRDFPANAQNMGWDGTFGGKPAPSDAYVYIAEVICDNAQVVTLSGNVTLIR